jgi:hypothetical protein
VSCLIVYVCRPACLLGLSLKFAVSKQFDNGKEQNKNVLKTKYNFSLSPKNSETKQNKTKALRPKTLRTE